MSQLCFEGKAWNKGFLNDLKHQQNLELSQRVFNIVLNLIEENFIHCGQFLSFLSKKAADIDIDIDVDVGLLNFGWDEVFGTSFGKQILSRRWRQRHRQRQQHFRSQSSLPLSLTLSLSRKGSKVSPNSINLLLRMLVKNFTFSLGVLSWGLFYKNSRTVGRLCFDKHYRMGWSNDKDRNLRVRKVL